MAQAVREIGPVIETPYATQYNWLQKYALMRSHPRKLYFDTAALLWVVNYLWHGRWGIALTLWLVTNVVSLIAVSDVDVNKMGETIYGKIILLHVKPSNVFFHWVGYVFLVQGLLSHSTQSILIGSSSILLGHLVGWNQVHSCFKGKK